LQKNSTFHRAMTAAPSRLSLGQGSPEEPLTRVVGAAMSESENVVPLHPAAMPEVSPEERARRLGVEVERLAKLPPFEWMLYLDDVAKKHSVESSKLKQMIEATIKVNEKKAADDRREVRRAKADDRREKQRAERKQEREDKLARQKEERARKEAERVDRERETRQKKREAVFAEIALLPRLTQLPGSKKRPSAWVKTSMFCARSSNSIMPRVPSRKRSSRGLTQSTLLNCSGRSRQSFVVTWWCQSPLPR
jgi:hypothetical protein